MATISLVAVVRDKEVELERLLSFVKDMVDEIIIVDTGSKDKTKVIANRFGSKIFDFKWNDDFSSARNLGIENAASDWILSMNADEMISEKDIKNISKLTRSNHMDCYAFPVRSYTNDMSKFGFRASQSAGFMGKKYKGFHIDNQIRLFRNMPSLRYIGPVHEYVDASKSKGKIALTDIMIEYELKSGSDFAEKQLKLLEIYEKNINFYLDKAKAYHDIGVLYLDYKKDNNKAVEFFNKSLKLDKKNAKSWFGIGLASVQLGDNSNAWVAFSNAWQLDRKNLKALILMAVAAEKDEDYKAAIDANEKLIKAGFPDKEMLVRKIVELRQKEAKADDYKLNISFG